MAAGDTDREISDAASYQRIDSLAVIARLYLQVVRASLFEVSERSDNELKASYSLFISNGPDTD
jgi:hypothetical protein